jgi:dihydrofolate reductase
MSDPVISLIVAMGANREIGLDNKLLWHIKDDLRLFMKTTSQHVVIHGRKSFESIAKPLNNRTNIIITRYITYKHSG